MAKRKFEIAICKCGRIHALDRDMVEETCYTNGYDNKDLALICGGCGKITLIGANYGPNMYMEPDDDDEDVMCYDCYTEEFKPRTCIELTPEAFNKSTKIVYDEGYKVPMKTGEYATRYYNGRFSDMTYPFFTEIERVDTTMDDVREFIDKFRTDRITVNMDNLVKELPDEVLTELSDYFIDAFDWTSTPYKKD